MVRASKKSMGKKKISKNPLLVLVLVAGGIFVNKDLILKYLPFSVSQKTESQEIDPIKGMRPEPQQEEALSSPSPGFAATFAPVSLEEEVPSPFGVFKGKSDTPVEELDLSKGSSLAKSSSQGNPNKDLRLSLILISGNSRSAIIGGKLVGEGDRISLGLVHHIQRDHLEILGSSGRQFVLRMRKDPLLVRVKAQSQESPPSEASPKPEISSKKVVHPKVSAEPQDPSSHLNPADVFKVLQGLQVPKGSGKE